MKKRLTERVKEELREVIRAGEYCIDGTVGNGYDTVFLAECVGEGGKVMGFDVQGDAISNTKKRLEEAGLLDRVILQELGHERMGEVVPEDWMGKVGCVMFNLGYLPGGNKGVITSEETSLRGIEEAVKLVRVGGMVSVMIYRGHEGGKEEYEAIVNWVEEGIGEAYDYLFEAATEEETCPVWLKIVKARDV